MLGPAFKGLGVVILVGAFIGMLAGSVMFLFGNQEANAAEDDLVLADDERQSGARDASATGAALFGVSLIAAGVGLVVMVGGMFVGGRRQEQQISAVAREATNTRPPTTRP